MCKKMTDDLILRYNGHLLIPEPGDDAREIHVRNVLHYQIEKQVDIHQNAADPLPVGYPNAFIKYRTRELNTRLQIHIYIHETPGHIQDAYWRPMITCLMAHINFDEEIHKSWDPRRYRYYAMHCEQKESGTIRCIISYAPGYKLNYSESYFRFTIIMGREGPIRELPMCDCPADLDIDAYGLCSTSGIPVWPFLERSFSTTRASASMNYINNLLKARGIPC